VGPHVVERNTKTLEPSVYAREPPFSESGAASAETRE
jgi:hypothetical protein